MISSSALGALLGALLLISSIPDAASYSKYGRTCKDIGCRSNEVCVMAEDPCSIYQRDNCGRYPTCAKSNQAGPSCTSMMCGANEYCQMENGVPKCVRLGGHGYESAGVSYVNGERVSGDDHEKSKPSSNTNPYANANAPPAPVDPVYPVGGGTVHQVNSGSNLGYPPYPSSSNNNGYPSYPSSNQGSRGHDLGYPPYPTQNRMPMPGYPPQGNGYPAQGYPAQAGHPPGYPQQYPGHQNYPYPAYPNQNRVYTDSLNSIYRRRNSATTMSASFMLVCLLSLLGLAVNRS